MLMTAGFVIALASVLLNILFYSFLQTGERGEEEYPPLPAYQSDSEPEKNEVYIVQVRGLPWSCTAEDLLNFFSGECLLVQTRGNSVAQ